MTGSTRVFARLRLLENLAQERASGLPRLEVDDRYWSALAFRVGDERFVTPIEQVAEIIPIPAVTRIPLSRPWVLGVANLRGEITPIFDLKGMLGWGETSHDSQSRVLVSRRDTWPLGLLVDESMGLRHFLVDARRPLGSLPEGLNDFVHEEVCEAEVHWKIMDLYLLLHGDEVLSTALQ